MGTAAGTCLWPRGWLGWVRCIGRISRPGSVTLQPAVQKKADCPVPGVSREVGSSSSLLGLGKLLVEKTSPAFHVLQPHALPPAGAARAPRAGREQSRRRGVGTGRWVAGEVGAGDKSCCHFPA